MVKPKTGPKKRPEGGEFLQLFFPELSQPNLRSDREAYNRLATLSCEAILADFIKQFDKGYAESGPGVLVVRLGHGVEGVSFLPIDDIRSDLELAESLGDRSMQDYLGDAVSTIESANINKCVVLMLADNSSTRIYQLDREMPAKSIQAQLEAFNP